MAEEVLSFIECERADLVQHQFYYTIVAPKSFRENRAYEIAVTVHRNTTIENTPDPDSIVVRVSIEDENDDKENAFKLFRDIPLKVDATEFVSLDVGNVPAENNYKLVVRGISGITVEREASLDLQTQKHAILIQTDKAIYKPNDNIQFRVLVLDKDLKAATINADLNICITVSVGSWLCTSIIRNTFLYA